MPITLRTADNPTLDSVVLSALAQVLVGYPTPNTQLAVASLLGTGLDQVYVQQEYQMIATWRWPALLLHPGNQSYTRMSQHTYDGTLQVYADYYDVWAEGTRTFDQIRADISADLERLKANVEENDSLTIGPQALTVSMPTMSLSPYAGMIRQTDTGKPLIYRRLMMNFFLLPYAVG